MAQKSPLYEQSERAPNASDKRVSEEVALACSRSDFRHALCVLMREYGDFVYRYCRRLLKDQHAAEDAHQTIFVLAYQNMSRLQDPSKVREWLFSIAHNLCMGEIRKKNAESKRVFECNTPTEVPSSELLLDEVDSLRHALKSLNECVEKLAPETRYTVLLRYQKERLLTYEEMGRICREQPRALQMRVARAMERLRRCLEGKGVTL